MAPILVPNLATLRAEFDQRWPRRDRTTDGWVGNLAHQAYPSGHNPDESGNAERQDADRIDEVRGLDLDADVDPAAGDELLAELDRIRQTPALRGRLIYMIYRRKIASASNGWVWVDYDGDSPHTEHGHVSGHPDHDDNTAPWGVAEGDDMTPQELRDADIWPNGYGDAATNEAITLGTFVRNVARDTEKTRQQLATVATAAATAAREAGEAVDQVVTLTGRVEQLAAAVGQLGTPAIDYDRLADAIVRRAVLGEQPPTAG